MTYFRFYIELTQNMRINMIQLAKESISGLSKVFTGSECPLWIITNWKYMNKADYGKAKAMLRSSAAVCLQSLYSCSTMLPLISQLLYGIYSPNWLQVTVSFCETQKCYFCGLATQCWSPKCCCGFGRPHSLSRSNTGRWALHSQEAQRPQQRVGKMRLLIIGSEGEVSRFVLSPRDALEGHSLPVSPKVRKISAHRVVYQDKSQQGTELFSQKDVPTCLTHRDHSSPYQDSYPSGCHVLVASMHLNPLLTWI